MNANKEVISNDEPFVPVSVVQGKPYAIEKITRSCDRSLSVNFQTYKVSTTLSATVKDRDATIEDINKMGEEIYQLAEAQTLKEINKIRELLNQGYN